MLRSTDCHDFYPRDALLARYMLRPCVAMSVCLSVYQAGIVPKRLNIGSYKQRRTIDQGLWFSDAKDLDEISLESAATRGKMQVE